MFTNTLRTITKKPKPTFTYGQIIFFGPLYSLIKKAGQRAKLRLHLSGDLYIRFPRDVIARIFKKRLVIFGERSKVQNIIQGILKLRLSDVYTGTGLRQRTSGYHKKPGKISRR